MTVLTEFNKLNTQSIIFGNKFDGHHRTIIPIGVKTDDEDIAPLIISTPSNLLSFGIQEITDKETSNTIGYQMPICLWGKRRVSDDERLFSSKLEEIAETCKNFLRGIKDEINVDDRMIDDIRILNWKYQNGERNEEKGPLLYTKLMLHNKNNRIMTYFIDEEIDTMVDPFDLLNKKCIVTAAIKLENIIIGRRISISVRLYEVLVRKLNTDKKVFVPKSLLKPDMAVKKIDRKKPKVVEKIASDNKFKALDMDDAEELVVEGELTREESVLPEEDVTV
jgi:hypothetical protein